MKLLLLTLPISCTILSSQPMLQPRLLLDRGIKEGQEVRLNRPNAGGFVGDHFRIGASGEIWVIDSLRTWATSGVASGHTSRSGSDFKDVTLFGGIEAVLPPPGQPSGPDCDCHNLAALKQ